MSGDFSRLTFTPGKHFDAVLMQQGRPQLDADWNEQQAINTHRSEVQTRDVVGLHGAPREHAGFGIQLRAALDFDGHSQAATVSSSGNLHGRGLERFTLELRVTLPQDHASAGTLVSGERSQWRLHVESDGKLTFSAGAEHHHNDTPVLTSQTALPFGSSTNVRLSCDGDTLRLGFDGQPGAEAPCPANGGPHTAPAVFGGPGGRRAGGDHFRGQIEDVSLRGSDGRVLAHWPMLGISRDHLLHDASGNDNDLEPSASAPRWVARDLLVGRGRLYVNGLVCENDRPVLLSAQPDAPGVQPPVGAPRSLVYLDVWKREIDAIVDPELREVALGGADTAVRAQIVWQARTLELPGSGENDDDDWRREWHRLLDSLGSTGALRAQHQSAAGTDVGNQLYRIEIHRSGQAGEATFTWSRDNGSVSFGVISIDAGSGAAALADLGRDSYALQTGDWVEYVDDTLELQRRAGVLLQVAGIDRARTSVTLTGHGLQQLAVEAVAHPRLRRWDQGDSGGEVTVPESPDTWVTLENGIQVSFAQGRYQSGDYWLVPTRSAVQDVQWPVDVAAGPIFQPPMGVHHSYCPLAVVDLNAEEPRVRDERRLFDPLTALPESDAPHAPTGPERDLRVEGDLTVRGDAHLHGDVHVGRLSGELSADLVDTEQLVDGSVTRAKLAPDVDFLPTGASILGTSPEPPAGFAYTGASLVVERVRRARVLEVDRPGTVSGAAIDQQLYLVSDLGSVWALELGSDRLREVTRMQRPRPDMRAIALGGHLLVVGGLNANGEPTGAVSELDLQDLSWRDRAPLAAPRRETGLGVLETHLHVVGGLRSAGEPVRRHDVYDLELDSWSTRADLPAPRRRPVAAGVAGRLVVVGSEHRGRQWRGGPSEVGRTDEFDPRRDRWVHRSPLPRGSSPLAALANDDQLFVLAEPETRPTEVAIAERWTYDPETDWWSERPPVRRPANGLTLARANAIMYLIGTEADRIHVTPVLRTLYVHARV